MSRWSCWLSPAARAHSPCGLASIVDRRHPFGIEPCNKGDEIFWGRNNIKNCEGRQVLELLESLSFHEWEGEWCIDKIQAKFHSPIDGQSGHFFGVPGADALTEYLPLRDNEDLPAKLWP